VGVFHFAGVRQAILRVLRRGRQDWQKYVVSGQVQVPVVCPIVIGCICHDPAAFTQGLVYKEDHLYESTGLYGKSSLRKIDAAGNIVANIPVPGVFGEGLAFHHEELVQLTWKEKLAIRYSFPALEKLGEFRYRGEGWGLTSDSENFIMSNGSGSLYIRDSRFKVVDKLRVKLEGKTVNCLNDLEFVNGKIYANVWYSNFLLEIDYSTCDVRRIIDCASLVSKEKPKINDTLNGIAYCEQQDNFYITGKRWNNVFIVKLP
jgi:glutamine cyclotransferase